MDLSIYKGYIKISRTDVHPYSRGEGFLMYKKGRKVGRKVGGGGDGDGDRAR